MEGNPPNSTQHIAKSTFKDILISANNDDVIIPVSATFDKVVIHIGIGNRSGVVIEKPPVKRGKKLSTSIEYATRKFTESRKRIVEPGEDVRTEVHEETDIGKNLRQLTSSLYSKTSFETKNSTEPGLLKHGQSGNMKNYDDKLKSKLQTNTDKIVVSGPKHEIEVFSVTKDVTRQSPDEQATNTDIALDKLCKTCSDAFMTTLPIKEIFASIDIAYENEMQAIATDNVAGFLKSKEFLSPDHTEECLTLANDTYLDGFLEKSDRGSHILAVGKLETSENEEIRLKTTLQNQTNEENDSRTSTQNKITSSKTHPFYTFEKNIMIALESRPAEIGLTDQTLISEIFTVPTLDKENDHRLCSDSIPNKSEPFEMLKYGNKLGDYFACQEEKEREHGSVSEQLDADASLEMEISDSETLETVVHIHSSISTESGVQLEPDKSVSMRGTFDDTESDGSVIDNSNDDVDEMLDSDTLNDVLDIDLDNEDVVNIETIATHDVDEVVTGKINVIADSTANIDDMYDDDDNIFGIMKVYINSGLHFYMDKDLIADHCEETKDFGYKFFSIATFFE